jgi:hypothetical protein
MELKRVFDKSPNYHIKILLGNFNAKVGREDIVNAKTGMRFLTKFVMIMELG